MLENRQMKTYRGVFPAIVAPQDDNNSILFDVMERSRQASGA